MLKKILTIAIAVLMLQSACVFANDEITIKVDGEIIKTDSPAILKDDRTFVPIRFVAEELDAEVLWSSHLNQVYINSGAAETIAVEKWYNDSFNAMMKRGFAEFGLNYEPAPIDKIGAFVCFDDKTYIEAFLSLRMDGKFIVYFDGEVKLGDDRTGDRGSLWYYDVETQKYEKIGNGYSVDSWFNPRYYDEKSSNLIKYYDCDGNLAFFDMETLEHFSMPDTRVLAVINHNVYHTDFKGKIYVHNLDDKSTREYPAKNINKYYKGVRSYTDGEKLYMLMDNEKFIVWEVVLETMEISVVGYEETEFPRLKEVSYGRETALKDNDAGVPKIYVNDNLVENIPEAFLLNDRTYVPIRFVAEALGAEVIWIDGENRVEINKQNEGEIHYRFAEDSWDIEKYYA